MGFLRLIFFVEENALFAGMRFQPLGSLLVLYEVSFPVTDAQLVDARCFMVFRWALWVLLTLWFHGQLMFTALWHFVGLCGGLWFGGRLS